MNPVKKSRRSTALRFILFALIALILVKILANLVAQQTTQIRPNFSDDRLIGRYIERDENHRPMRNAATIDFRPISMNENPSNFLIFTYIPFDQTDTTSIIFENLTINNAFTPKEDKIYGFDGVLKPINYLKNVDLENLYEISQNMSVKPDFPKGCVFKAFNNNFGPSYGIGWAATKNCQTSDAPIALRGHFRRTGAALRSDLLIQTSGNKILVNHRGRNVYFGKTN